MLIQINGAWHDSQDYLKDCYPLPKKRPAGDQQPSEYLRVAIGRVSHHICCRHRASAALQGLRGNGISELGRPCTAALGWRVLSVLRRLIGEHMLAQSYVNTTSILGRLPK